MSGSKTSSNTNISEFNKSEYFRKKPKYERIFNDYQEASRYFTSHPRWKNIKTKSNTGNISYRCTGSAFDSCTYDWRKDFDMFGGNINIVPDVLPNSKNPSYNKSVDAWDVADIMFLTGSGERLYGYDRLDKDLANKYKSATLSEDIDTKVDILRGLFKNVPLNSLVGVGDAKGTYVANKEENKRYPRHTISLIGWNKKGDPYFYSMGDILSLESLARRYTTLDEIKHITAPSKDQMTFDKYVSQYGMPEDAGEIKPIDVEGFIKDLESSGVELKGSVKNRISNIDNTLLSNRESLQKYLGLTDKAFDDLRRQVIATSVQESGTSSKATLLGDAIVGKTEGPLQINKDVAEELWNKYPYIIKSISPSKRALGLLDPDVSAVTAMMLMSENLKRAPSYWEEGKDAVGNKMSAYKEDVPAVKRKLYNRFGEYLSEDKRKEFEKENKYNYYTEGSKDIPISSILSYMWQSPYKVKYGDAGGDSKYVKNINSYLNTLSKYKQGGKIPWNEYYNEANRLGKGDTTTYSLYNAWKNLPTDIVNDFVTKPNSHLPDTYKKPSHPTMSTESIYSTDKLPGGTWMSDNTYYASPTNISSVGDWNSYLKWMKLNNNPDMNVIPKYGFGGDILSGIVSGASTGSVIPGWGTLAGAIGGGLLSLIKNPMTGINNKQTKNVEQMSPAYNEFLPTFQNGGPVTEDPPWVKTGYFPGAVNPGMAPNAELEKEETFVGPDGSMGKVNAPTHEQGGVKMNLDPGTRVYSDTLTYMKGKTFSDIAESYMKKVGKNVAKLDKYKDTTGRKSSMIEPSTNSAKRNIRNYQKKLDDLFIMQEMKKATMSAKGVRKGKLNPGNMPKYKCGGKVKKMPEGGTVFKDLTPYTKWDKMLNNISSFIYDKPANLLFGKLDSTVQKQPSAPIPSFEQSTSVYGVQPANIDKTLLQRNYNNPVIPNVGMKLQVERDGGTIRKFQDGGGMTLDSIGKQNMMDPVYVYPNMIDPVYVKGTMPSNRYQPWGFYNSKYNPVNGFPPNHGPNGQFINKPWPMGTKPDEEWYNRWREYMDSTTKGAWDPNSNKFDEEWYNRWREYMDMRTKNGSSQAPPNPERVSPLVPNNISMNDFGPSLSELNPQTKAATRSKVEPMTPMGMKGLPNVQGDITSTLKESPAANVESPYKEPNAWTNIKSKGTDILGNFNYGNIAKGLGALAPTIYNTIMGMTKPDILDEGRYRNREAEAIKRNISDMTYDIYPQLRSNVANYNQFNRNIGNVAQSGGAYASNLLSGMSAKNTSDAAAWATKNNMENQYRANAANALNSLGAQNVRGLMAVDDYNAASRAARRNYLGAATTGLSNYVQNKELMGNMANRDAMMYEMYNRIWGGMLNNDRSGNTAAAVANPESFFSTPKDYGIEGGPTGNPMDMMYNPLFKINPWG